jgi:hypothetical protein
MNEITKDKIDKLFLALKSSLEYLYMRWQDEKECEPWADYAEKMRSDFNEELKDLYMTNAVFVKARKRPFGFLFDFEGWEVSFEVSAKQMKWSAWQ